MLKILLWRTLQIRKKRLFLTVAAILMGSSLISAMIAVSSEMDRKVGKELRSYGSNLLVLPQDGSYLREVSLLNLKKIFFLHNLVGIAPIIRTKTKISNQRLVINFIGTWFDQPLETKEGKWVKTGAKQTFPWWKVKGRWPIKQNEVLVGALLARKLDLKPGGPVAVVGADLRVRPVSNQPIKGNHRGLPLQITGILKESDYDSAIVGSTAVAQELAGRKNQVDEVKISAMIVPKLKLPASIRNKKVNEMTRKEYRIWYCTPTVGAISTQIKEVVPNARVKNLRQFTEAEGRLLSQIELMIFLTIVFSLVATVLAVMTSTTAAVIERKGEIGLAKSIGASDAQIAFQFLAELAGLALLGGTAGYFIGLGLAQVIGQAVFSTSVSFDMLTLAITLGLSFSIAILGSFLPIRKAMKIQPVVAMRGN